MDRRLVVVLAVCVSLSGCIDTSYRQPQTRGEVMNQDRKIPRLDSLAVESETSKWAVSPDRNDVGKKFDLGQVGTAFPSTAQPTQKVPEKRDTSWNGPRS